MKKLSKLSISAIFLAAIFALSACGGARQESGQSGEQAPPPEPTQAESEAPADGDAPSQPEEAQPEEDASEEDAPSEDAADGSGEGVSSEAQSSGPSATTIQGEEVSLGGGEVTALFFMAGW